jgi:hypothetical protein
MRRLGYLKEKDHPLLIQVISQIYVTFFSFFLLIFLFSISSFFSIFSSCHSGWQFYIWAFGGII